MRKFTKSLLALALMVFAVGGAKAEKVYADLSQYGDKWDGVDLTFSWTATSGNQLYPTLDNGGLPKGDLRSWQKLVVVVDELSNCDFFRVLVYNGADANHSNTFKVNKTGKNEFVLSGNVDELDKVTKIVLSGSNWEDSKNSTWAETPASFKVKEVYLERPDVVYMTEEEIYKAPAGTTDIDGMTGTGSIKWSITYPQVVANETLWGGDIDSDNKSVDISSYDYLHFVVSSVSADAHTGLRVFVYDGSARQCLYPHPIAEAGDVTDWKATTWITAPGTYVVKISDYPLLRGFKALQGWAGNAGEITVAQAYVSAGSPVAYTSSGLFNIKGEESLADATVTCFDVTALSGSGITYDAANPNALFIAKAGQLTNTKNVIVDGVCANLDLTDGYAFQAPAAFTATAAKFAKSVTGAGFATMVMPFAATLPTGVKAYNLTAVSGTSITSADADAIAADKPVLIEAAEGNYAFTATDAAIAATAEGVVTNGLLNGTYVGAKAAAGANNYVLQNGTAGLGFFLVTGTEATVKPFRAYLNTGASAPEFLPFGGGATGIETVKAAKANNEIFNLAGQRVAQPAKGLYIVNGRKVVMK